MIWHWLIFLGLSTCVFIEQFTATSKKSCGRICKWFTILFIFLATIRWNQLISDWSEYHAIYSRMDLPGFLDIFRVRYWSFEPIFFLTIRIIKFFLGSYIFVQFFMALIAIGVFYFAAEYINKYSLLGGKEFGTGRSLIVASFLVFWATTFANVYTVRTNLAAAVCVFSIRYIEGRKPLNFFATILIATGLHFSALIFLVAYFVYNKKINIKVMILLIIGSSIVGAVGIEKLINLVALLGGRYAEKISRYNYRNGSKDFGYYLYSTRFLIIRAFANTVLVLGICLFVKRCIKNNDRFNGMFNIYFTGALLQVLTITYNIEFARIAMFFQTFQYFLLPYSFMVFKKNKSNKILVYLMFITYMAVKMYSLYHREAGYMSFHTVFS